MTGVNKQAISTEKEVRLSNGLVIRAKTGTYGPFLEFSKLLREDKDITVSAKNPQNKYLSVSTPNVGDAASMSDISQFFVSLMAAHDQAKLASVAAPSSA